MHDQRRNETSLFQGLDRENIETKAILYWQQLRAISHYRTFYIARFLVPLCPKQSVLFCLPPTPKYLPRLPNNSGLRPRRDRCLFRQRIFAELSYRTAPTRSATFFGSATFAKELIE